MISRVAKVTKNGKWLIGVLLLAVLGVAMVGMSINPSDAMASTNQSAKTSGSGIVTFASATPEDYDTVQAAPAPADDSTNADVNGGIDGDSGADGGKDPASDAADDGDADGSGDDADKPAAEAAENADTGSAGSTTSADSTADDNGDSSDDKGSDGKSDGKSDSDGSDSDGKSDGSDSNDGGDSGEGGDGSDGGDDASSKADSDGKKSDADGDSGGGGDGDADGSGNDDGSDEDDEEKNESGTESGSPKYFKEAALDTSSTYSACNYLSFCRWKGVNQMPQPHVGFTSMTQLPDAISGGLAQLAFAIAGLGMFLIGVVLIFVISIDLLSKGVYTADYLFSSITGNLLGITESPGAILASIIIAVVVGLVGFIALPGLSRFTSKIGFQWGMRSIGIMVVAIAALMMMSLQSMKNHPNSGTEEKAPIASMAEGDGSRLADAPDSGIEKPGNWAFGSPGWFVAGGNWMAQGATGFVNEFSQKISNAIDTGFTGRQSNCTQYVNGMHRIFNQTSASDNLGGKGSVLIAYDTLMNRLYFSNYAMAGFGNSTGANNSWCRMAENQASSAPGDQMFISRVSGLYKEVVGTGGMGIVDDSKSKVVDPGNPMGSGVDSGNSKGKHVTASGEWTKDANIAIPNASSYIGPTFISTDGGNEAAMYFAACRWPNPSKENGVSEVELNGEWEGVQSADSGGTLSNGSCRAGDITNMTDKPQDSGFGSDSEGAKNFNYKEDDGWPIVGPMFGWGASGMAEKFAAANEAGNNSDQAYMYYLKTLGVNQGVGLILSVITVALIWLTVRYFGPVAIGAMFAQTLSLIIMIMLGILFLILIVPLRACRMIFMTAVKMVAATIFITTLIAALFQVTFNFATLFTSLLSFNTKIFDPLFQAIIAGVGAWLAFWAVRILVHSVTGLNIASIRGGIQTGIAATSPALQQMGFDVASPLSSDFWGIPFERFRRKKSKEEDVELRNDENSPIRSDEGRTNDNRDLLADKDINRGDKNRKTNPDLAVGRDQDKNLDRETGKKKPSYFDKEYLRNGQKRRTNEGLGWYDNATMAVNGAALIPGPQAPYVKGAGAAMTAGGKAVQFGRWSKDHLDQTKSLGKEGFTAANAGKDFMLHEASRQLSGDVGSRERGIYFRGRGQDAFRDRNGMAMAEIMPGVPRVDRDALSRDGIPTPSQELYDSERENIPGLMGNKDADRMDSRQVLNSLDTQNANVFSPISNSHEPGIEKDAAVSWMGGRFSQNNSGLYLPKGTELTPAPQGEDLRDSVKGWGTGDISAPDIPVGGQVVDSSIARANQGMDIPTPEDGANSRVSIMSGILSRVGEQQDIQSGDRVLGGKGMLNEWSDIVTNGVSSTPAGSDPSNRSNWSPDAQNRADSMISKIADFVPMDSNDLRTGQREDSVMHFSGDDGSGDSRAKQMAREAGKKMAAEATRRAADWAIEKYLK